MKEKKSYEAPEMKVYQVQKANIIATSGTQTNALGIYDNQGFTEETW